MRFRNFDNDEAAGAPYHSVTVTTSNGGGASMVSPSNLAPRLQSSAPADNATSNVPVNPVIVLHFDQLMAAGSGNIYITDGATQTVIDRATGLPTTRIVGASDTRQIAVGSSAVSIDGDEVTITLAQPLKLGATYSVQMGKGVLQGTNHLPYAGLQDSTKLNFTTTIAGDLTPPSATSAHTTNAAGTYKVGDTISIEVSFSESVAVTGTPLLKLETGATDRSATYVSGNHSDTLVFAYTVQAADLTSELNFVGGGAGTAGLAGELTDESGNLLDSAHISFSSLGAAIPDGYGTHSHVEVDGVAPTIDHWSVADGTTGVDAVAGISITFSENIAFGNGDLIVFDDLISDAVPSIAWDSPNVHLSGNVLTVTDLPAEVDQMIVFLPGSVKDLAGNTMAGSPQLHVNTATDTVAPTLVSLPGLLVTNLLPMTITMSENIHAGTGNIVFTDTVGGAQTSIPAASLTFSGHNILVPVIALHNSHSYNVTMDAGVVLDSHLNPNIAIVGTAPVQVLLPL